MRVASGLLLSSSREGGKSGLKEGEERRVRTSAPSWCWFCGWVWGIEDVVVVVVCQMSSKVDGAAGCGAFPFPFPLSCGLSIPRSSCSCSC